MIENHHRYTQSTLAESILNDWDQQLKRFVKVMPTDYKRVLMEQQQTALAS
jgi:glutamate synthase domain-containing protein 3